VVDGIIDMRPNGAIVDAALVKQIRVRKMASVRIYPESHAYGCAPDTGMVVFDPVAEMEDDGAGVTAKVDDASTDETEGATGSTRGGSETAGVGDDGHRE